VNCIMCHNEFDEKDLDFVGRCFKCFKDYLSLPKSKLPELGIPFTPVSKAIK